MAIKTLRSMLAKLKQEGQRKKIDRQKRKIIRKKACRRGRAKIIIESIEKIQKKILPNERNGTATNVTRPIWETVGLFVATVIGDTVQGMFVEETKITGDRVEVSTSRNQRKSPTRPQPQRGRPRRGQVRQKRKTKRLTGLQLR